MKKILFVLLIALCGVSFGFGKPTNPSDSVAEVLAVEPAPEAANAADCADCDYARQAGGYVPDFIEEIEECIDNCMNK